MIEGIPAAVLTLARRCQKEGGRAYLVGGGVRDHLLGRPFHDWDVEVFGVPIDALGALLRKLGTVSAVGKSFGVYKLRPWGSDSALPEIDVSVPRRDSKVGPGHRGIAVVGDPNMTVLEATRRRDLTINAIMYDILDNVLVDPWHGREDLERRLLRAVDAETFLEDPLRALRVLQFAARLDFAVDPSLVFLCREASLDELPAERIQGEWGKLLLSRRPAVGMRLGRETRILERVFPEVADAAADEALDRLASGQRDTLSSLGQRWAVMLATWLHGAAPADVEATLDRLWLHKMGGYPLRERVLQAVAHWRDPIATDADLRHLSTRTELGLALRVRWAVTAEDTVLDRLVRAQALGVHAARPEPLLQGRDLTSLGVRPGPEMGRLLKQVYTRQLDGDIRTKKEALAEAKALYRA